MTEQVYRVDGSIWTRRITLFWLIAICLAALFDVFLNYLEWLPGTIIRRSFDIGYEESFGTWISTSLSLFVAIVAGCVAVARNGSHGKPQAFGWGIISAFFLFMSFDDAAKFHERVGTTLRLKYESISNTLLDSWFPSYGWQLFVAPLFAVMGIFVLVFLWRSVRSGLRFRVFLGLGLFALAVVADFLEGTILISSDAGEHFLRLAEEVMEMLANLLFLNIFLQTLNDSVSVHLERTALS